MVQDTTPGALPPPSMSALNGALFLVRHLLILKELATGLGLDIEEATKSGPSVAKTTADLRLGMDGTSYAGADSRFGYSDAKFGNELASGGMTGTFGQEGREYMN